MPAAKKFLNDPKNAVVESLEGLVAATPHLQRLDGFPGVTACQQSGSPCRACLSANSFCCCRSKWSSMRMPQRTMWLLWQVRFHCHWLPSPTKLLCKQQNSIHAGKAAQLSEHWHLDIEHKSVLSWKEGKGESAQCQIVDSPSTWWNGAVGALSAAMWHNFSSPL